MGCTCSREEAKAVINSEIKKFNSPVIIKISIPKTDRIKLIIHECNSDEVLITDLINTAFFNNDNYKELDANFISVYDSERNMFKYHIQRLIGYEIDDENPETGNMWMVFINRVKYDWSFLCIKNRLVKKNDEIEFRFEKY